MRRVLVALAALLCAGAALAKPEDAPAMPRKMLPPPITTPTSTPRSVTVFTSLTMRHRVSRLMP